MRAEKRYLVIIDAAAITLIDDSFKGITMLKLSILQICVAGDQSITTGGIMQTF